MANPNPQFRITDPAALHALVRAQPLATLVLAHQGALHANHVPMYLDPQRGAQGTLIGHVARANTLWPLLPQTALALFHGPQAYVSPAWYPSKAVDGKQVPTWNYTAVHAHGRLSAVHDPQRLHALLHTLAQSQEAQRPNPWAIADAPPDYIAKLLRAIVGVELVVERWQGIAKLSQNRSDSDHAGVVQGLLAETAPAAQALAQLMRDRVR